VISKCNQITLNNQYTAVHRKRIIDQKRGRLQIRKCVLVIYKKQFKLITHWQAEIG